MAHDLVAYLMKEKIAEYERELAAKDQQLAAKDQQLAASALREQQALQQTLEAFLRVRFPAAPPATFQAIRQITNPNRLQHLADPLFQAPDLDTAIQLLTQAAAEEQAVTGSER